MRRLILALIIVLCFVAKGDAGNPTFPTCSNLSLGVGCEAANTIGTILWDQGVNLRYFGAKGDNVTDDTAAIQAAIDFAANNNLNTIVCPAGNYVTSSPIYLDPPGNLRSNLSSPTNFAFSLAFVGLGRAAGEHEGNSPGCRLKPNFNNAVAFYVGTGQRMRVADIAIVGPANGYRANQNSSGVCLGTTGGSGGSSGNLIENVWCENFYTSFQTQANGGCCVNDSNKWSRVVTQNAYYGINIVGGQTDINVIDQSHLEATVAVFNGTARQTTIIGGDMGSGSAQKGSFSISGTSALSVAADANYPSINDISFTTTVASPDIYFPNVYTAFTIVTSHFGVIPMTMTNWNAGTSVATLQILPGWIGSHYGNENLKTSTDLQAEIQAVTTLYATELTKVFWGAGFHATGVHVENPSACTSLLQAGEGASGDPFVKLDNLFFNYIIAHTPAVDGSALAIFYCQQTFPFIVQERGSNTIEINGGDFLQTQGYSDDGVIIDSGDNSLTATMEFRNLGQSLWAPNLRFYGSVSNIIDIIGNFFNLYADAKSQGHAFARFDVSPFFTHSATAVVQHSFDTVGEMAGPYCGYRPCPWTTPSLPPGLLSTINGTLPALGTYPLINCETVYRSVEWNSGSLAHIHERSASCPGTSYGQNLDDSTVNSSNSSFTATISNGAGGSGTQLNVSVIASGAPTLNAEVTGAGVPVGEYITACPGGTCGGTGIYTVSQAANISAESMKSYGTQVTWSYKGQTNALYLDAKTLSWMKAGLGIGVPDPTSGTDYYIVTGVYPTLGYVTVVYANSDAGGVGLIGTKTTVYSCSNQCAISQKAYSFTAY